MDPDALLDGLDDAQRRAVASPAHPLVILAPAGSGKTRVLTRRIAHRIATDDADPRRVLALTFTRKAAAELTERLRRLGLRGDVHAGTFHAVAWAQLRARWHDLGRTEPTLLDRKGPFLADLVPRAQGRDPRAAARDLATEIEWAKARVVDPDGYPAAATAAGRRPAMGVEVVAERYRAYEVAKAAARLVDFDDLLGLCLGALESDERFAAAQRWRYRHLFVDELQDVNPLQFRLLEAWRGPGDDICAVGDPQQAIYGWNGADAGFLLDIGRWWPAVEIIELETSYRSSPQVLDAAAAVLRGARQPARQVIAARPDGVGVRVAAHADDRAEAVAVARAVRLGRAPGRPWADQAVLVRTHAQTALLAEALREVGIPHRVRGAAALLDRPAVRRALRTLRDARTPLGTALADLAAEAGAGAPPWAGEGIDHGGGGDVVDDPVAWLIELGRDYLRLDPLGRADGFARWITATVRREGADDSGDAVDLVTFHAAKGLEWATVHLAGIEDGFVPIAHARTKAAKAEEARLLYVAMTRAQRELRLTWARQRSFAGRIVERRRSPLLDPLDADPAPPVPPQPVPPAELVPSWRSHLDAQREVLAAAAGAEVAAVADQPALAALRRWRDEAARAARIEPDALLDDRILQRIVAAAPTDEVALGRVRGVGPVLAARFGPAMLSALGARRAPA